MAEYKVLVTGPSWIGDMVMAQSLFKYLQKTSEKELIIDVLAPAWTLPVVNRMPEVRKGIKFDSRHGKLDLKLRYSIGKGLKQQQYDEAIIIPRTLKAVLPSWFAGIKKITGYQSNFGLVNNIKSYRKSRKELFVKRYLSLALDNAYQLNQSEIPVPELIVDELKKKELLETYSLKIKNYVVFAPGAEFGPSKQWPMDNFAALAELLEGKGLQVIILGSDKEREHAESIMQISSSNDILNLCGKTTLENVIDIMSGSTGVVANDSGLMHLAYASGAKVYALYGSSSPEYTPPLSTTAHIFQHKLSCQPCFERTCRYDHYQCLTGINAEQVADKISL